MGNALAKTAEQTGWTADQVDLIKRTVARGASDDELKLFLYTCQRTGLDPFAKQAYCLKRRENVDGQWVDKATFQTGIDGYRLIADRTGKYAPGREPTFEYRDGQLLSATTYVKKQTADGTWHEIAATAHYSEYVALKRDGQPNRMWSEKPHIMLAKCAEALALRRAFPAELSGIYTDDEMDRHNATHDAEFTPKQQAALPAPKQEPAKPNGPQLPANGLELRQRLGNYDGRLATEKVCKPGELLSHVARSGTDQGWSDDITTWDAPEQIRFAVEETKRFEAAARGKLAKPTTIIDGIAFANELDATDKRLCQEGVLHQDENPNLDESGSFKRRIISGMDDKRHCGTDPSRWKAEDVAYGRELVAEYMAELCPT